MQGFAAGTARVITDSDQPSGRVLIVDDDDDIRDGLGEILMLEGYDVSSVCNGREALAWLDHHPAPDLILLDLMMPVMSGAEFRQAQRGDPRLADIPVVVISAGDEMFQRTEVPDAEDYLQKPVDIERLLEAVEENTENDGV